MSVDDWMVIYLPLSVILSSGPAAGEVEDICFEMFFLATGWFLWKPNFQSLSEP